MPIDNSGKPSRGLPYPLVYPQTSNLTEYEAEVTKLTPDMFPEDSDEPIDIIMNFSLNEFVSIASALEIGSDIGYGDDRNAIWVIWVKALKGIPTMTCEDIIDCIENDPDVMTAVINSLNASGLINPDMIDPDTPQMNNRFNPATRANQIIEFGEDCDLDVLWASCQQLVQGMDKACRDFLETVVSEADKVQRMATAIGAIPIFGDLGKAVVESFAEIAEDMLNGYDAFSTEALLNDIACHFFDQHCEDCTFPTYDELMDYYSSLGQDEMDTWATLSLSSMMSKFLDSVASGNPIIFYSMNTMLLYVLYLGSTFVGMRGVGWLEVWADEGEEFANDAWETLCEGCTPDPEFEPIIDHNTPCAVAGQSCGTIVSNPSPNVWRISSTHRAEGNDEGATIADIEGRTFKITGATKVSGSDITFSTRANAACATTSAAGLNLNNNIVNIIYVAPNNATWTYDFTFELV